VESKILITFILGLISALTIRYVWDRFLSQSSRVTQKEYQKEITRINNELSEGANTFKEICRCISVMCMCQLDLCEKLHIDCSDIREIMVKGGLGL
jgi:H+/gluconate symporter-like permease